MSIQLYSALLLNIFFLWVATTEKITEPIKRRVVIFCKIAFAATLYAALYEAFTMGIENIPSAGLYIIFMVPSILVLLFLDGSNKIDVLIMPTILLNIYLLLQNRFNSEFLSFMSYMAVNLVLIIGDDRKKGTQMLKSILTNISFYTLAWMIFYVLGQNDGIHIGATFISLGLFVVILLQCVGASPFCNYYDELYLKTEGKLMFKMGLLFVLFVMPIHLMMLKPVFSLLDDHLQNIFLALLVVFISASLWREYVRGSDELTAMVNIKLFIISIFLLVFLTEEYEFFQEFYYMSVPFVLVHMPIHTKKEEIFCTKDRVLNYIFLFLVLGFSPSVVFKVKSYALLILFYQNPYLCFLFVLSATLVVINFLIFFIRNDQRLIYIKNPLYFAFFLAIICVYLFSVHIPDKI